MRLDARHTNPIIAGRNVHLEAGGYEHDSSYAQRESLKFRPFRGLLFDKQAGASLFLDCITIDSLRSLGSVHNLWRDVLLTQIH